MGLEPSQQREVWQEAEAVGSEVVAACDFGGLRRAANDSLRSG